MNQNQIEKYINEYGRHVYSFCIYLTRDKQDADDLYQQTFLTAIEKNDFDDDKNPKSYLITIASNIWNNHKRKYLWRKQKADVIFMLNEDMEQLISNSESVEENVIRRDEARKIIRLVYELPYKMKTVILMFYMEEMTIEEIANALSIPVGTVKNRLHQARERLKERMAD